MNQYDVILILKPQLSEEEVAAYLEKVMQKVQASGGAIEKNQKLGRRRLPYRFKRFKNQSDGVYCHLLCKAPAAFPKELQIMLKISEEVVRYLVACFDPSINTIPIKPKPRPDLVGTSAPGGGGGGGGFRPRRAVEERER